jgi:hypothetical protein
MELRSESSQKRTPSSIRTRGCTQFVASDVRLLGIEWPGVSGDGDGHPAWPNRTIKQVSAAQIHCLRQLGVGGRIGESERLRELASELVHLKVDLIVTHNTPPPLAAKQATSTIPIVFATAGDPVGTGIVASLARPGGNITGLSSQTPETASKRLELLRDIVPGLRQLAILSDMDNPFVKLDLSQMRKAAANLGIEIATFQITRGDDIPPSFEALKGHSEALYVPAIPVAFVNRTRINTLALAARPTNIAQCARVRRSRRFNVLWTELAANVGARRRFNCQDFARS